MGFATYADLARNRAVRRILVLAMVLRVPLWAAGVVLTLHVVGHLDRNYAEAGAVDMVYSVALAVSSPWRGRLLDRLGLRRTVGTSIGVLAVCWGAAPWVGYWELVGLVAVAGLFAVPSFSIVRQVLISAVPDSQRTAALSMDSVFVEFTFMIGPIGGVLAATTLGTPIALLVCQAAMIAGAAVLLWEDPPLLRAEEASDAIPPAAAGEDLRPEHPQPETVTTGSATHAPVARGVRSWISPGAVLVLMVAAIATIVLTGADLSTVAAMRHLETTSSLGWVLALWGLGSATGGVVYGALHRHPPAALLLVGLGATTAAVAWAPGLWQLALLLTISGLFCAPTITATIDELSRMVPARGRGEAMGWHGSALTLGGAAGAPAVGWAIDRGGWSAGFSGAGLAGLAMAAAALAWTLARRGGGARHGDQTGAPARGGVEPAVEPAPLLPGPAVAAGVGEGDLGDPGDDHRGGHSRPGDAGRGSSTLDLGASDPTR